MKRIRILALLTAISLLLTGCASARFITQLMGLDADPYAPYGYLQLVPFEEMTYEHMDADAIAAKFDAAAEAAQTAEDADTVIDALEAAYGDIIDFYTMDTLAMIHTDLDTTDLYYPEEYAYCEQQLPMLGQAQERALQACAKSPQRKAMETMNYFAPGELDAYESEGYYNEETVALLEKENELLADYRALIADPVITLNGEQIHLDDYMAEDITDAEYQNAYTEYLRQINADAAQLYCELVRVRKQIAEAGGYAGYAEQMFEDFARDYTPEDALDLIQTVQRELVPSREKWSEDDIWEKLPAMSEGKLMNLMEQSMQELGAPAAEVFRIMKNYHLYDVTPSIKKSGQSYTTYLNSYGVPFMMISAYGDFEDLLVVSHEFGHFLSDYESGNGAYSLDLAETFSQSMSFLSLSTLKDTLSDSEYDLYRRLILNDILSSIMDGSLATSFEMQVFDLPDSELTPENLNRLYAQCLRDYGTPEYAEDAYRLAWTQISHLYDYPFYMISYCMSADTALQIYLLEEENGTGWDCYQTLLDYASETYLTALDAAELDSPLEKTCFYEALELLSQS